MPQDLLANLSSLYYSKLSEELKNPTGFQVATGSTQVSDQATINAIADGIPAKSLDSSFSGNPINSYSGNYANIIDELKSPNNVSNALGAQYDASWETYKKTNAASIDFNNYLKSMQLLMQKWGVSTGIPNGIVQAGVNALAQEMLSAVTVAQTLLVSNQGNACGFLPQYPNVAIQFNNPSPCSFSITSIQQGADLSNSWAEGSFGVLADIFEFGNETSFSSESQKFTGNGFNLNFSCRQVSVDVKPIGVGEAFSIANDNYGAWQSNAALQLAYKSPNDASVWQRAADWQKFFGPTGTFSRVVTKIFLADGINLVMNSTATFTSEEHQELQSAAEGGFWPFFIAKASGGYSTTVTHNDDNTITVTTTSPQGVYILLGVATDSISHLMTGQA